jgi:hypothetical protein
VPPVPPPVPPVPPPVVPPLVPEVAAPLVPPDVPDDELSDPVDAEGEEPLDDVVAVVLEVEVVDDAAVVAGAVMRPVGTVSGGAPVVSVAAEPLPHAAMPAAAAAPTASAVSARVARRTAGRRATSKTSGLERIHPPAAVRTVVEVLLAVLVAPVAEAKVLDGPRQLGWSRRQGQQLSHDFEHLTGLPIDVGPSNLGVDHDLATSGWRPHPVLLTRPHP